MTARSVLLLSLLPLTLALGCPKIGSTSSGGSSATDIELTGIESFDSIFREARDLDERVDNAKAALDQGVITLNSALGLTEGTPFSDAVTELRTRAEGKLKVVVEDGGGLSLEATDAVPSNVQAAVDALNATLDSYKAAIADIGGAKDDAASLVAATKNLPSQLQSDFKSFDLALNEVPGKLATVQDNVRIIGNMPERIDKLGGAMKDNVTVVSDVIGGKGTSATPTSTTTQEQGNTSNSGSSTGPRTLKRD